MSPQRAAVVDIGTNSVLLTIAARGPLSDDATRPETLRPETLRGDVVRAELELATITRLGEGVDATRRLAPAAVERTLDCLRDYGSRIRQARVDVIALVGTSALRDAAGGEPFIARAAELIGAPLEVISGQREAELTFRGALSGLQVQGPIIVFDIGGGSTEIISGETPSNAHGRTTAPTTKACFSFDVGSVRLTERHVRSDPPSTSELDAMRRDVRALWGTAPPALAPLFERVSAEAAQPTIVGVAGTVTTLAALELGLDCYDPERVHGATLSAAGVARLAERLGAVPLAERRKLAGLEPRRADVIVAGAVLCAEVLRALGATELVVSDRGVRWGLLDELLQP